MIALPLAIGIAVFAAVAIVLDSVRTARLRRRVGAVEVTESTPLRERAAAVANERLAQSRAGQALARRLERAGIAVHPALAVAAAAAIALLLALLGSLAVGAFAFLLAPLLVAAVTPQFLAVREQRRLRAFDAQLPELTAALASSLRAGHGLPLALDAVAADAAAPAGPELRRVVAESRLGRPLAEALDELAQRVPSEDLRFLVAAITLQRELGGSLAPLLDTATGTIRQRQQFTRKIRALTASIRLSARVLVGLPVVLSVLLTLVNRGYMRPLWTTSTGHLLVVAAVAGMLAGSLVLRRIAAPRE